MAVYNKFQNFVLHLGQGDHNLKATGDVTKCYLTSGTPVASGDITKSDLAEITTFNGYTSGGHDTTNTYTLSSGVVTLGGTDIVITATGGVVGPFRYVIHYNDTMATSAGDLNTDGLINWWDFGSALTLQCGESFTIDFATGGIFTLT